MNIYNDILEVFEKKSTCVRLQVAAIIVSDDRIISTGWNGVPKGHKHCNQIFNATDQATIDQDHRTFSEQNEIHAEQNAIAFAARKGIATENCDLYVSVSPCTACAKLIISAGIKNVYYKKLYDRETYGLDLLKQSNINLIKLDE